MPPATGSSWKCKTMLSAAIPSVTIAPYDDAGGNVGSGYLYFTPEQYCFGTQVMVVVQPNDGFYDFNRLGETDDPAKLSKLFLSKFGTRFLVPAEYDVIV